MKTHRIPWSILLAAFIACFAAAVLADTNADKTGEPTNATEAALQSKYGDKVKLADYLTYREIVDALPPKQKQWENVLEKHLGGFYFPIYLARRIKPSFVPESSEWGFVADDPDLPRVILIGDSISRSYTVSVRKLLAGKANVHRAPANCGPTDSGLRNMDVWLDQGNGKWDIIYFNFGIHDRRKTSEQYAANLEKVIERLRQTGATLIFARTTPFKEKTAPETDGSIALNAVSDAVMKQHEIPTSDLHAAVADRLATVQGADHVHFNAEGIKLLAQQVAKDIETSIAAP